MSAVFMRVLLSLLLIELCFGCGITTHTEIGYRAVSYFSHTSNGMDYRQLLLDNQDAFEAGNPYPDAFYSNICYQGLYHGVSEDTHWAEFLNATISYIRATYPPPWNNDTQKLIAFTLGFVSHQVADVSWHSLGIDQGFLSAMGFVEDHGSFDKAHSIGDTGGDVVNNFREDLSYSDPEREWYVPVDDLVNIYKLFYQKEVVTKEIVEDCVLILFIGRLGERLALSKAFPHFAAESSFLVDNLDNYFLGGQNDMAVWTARIWNETIYMLEQGSRNCSIPHNSLYIRCPSDVDGKRQKLGAVELGALQVTKAQRNGFFVKPEYYGFRDDGTNVFGLSRNDVLLERHARGTTFRPTSSLLGLVKKMREQQSDLYHRDGNRKQFGRSESVPEDYSGPDAKPRKDDPSISRDVSSTYPSITFNSVTPYARLGESVLSHDLNGDGNDDLIIGAPGHGGPGNPEQGVVYIVYGDTLNPGTQRSIRIIETSANVTLFGVPYQAARFGSAMAVLDLNADGLLDLAVSAPSMGSSNLTYNGSVYIYFGRPLSPIYSTADVTITCKLRYCNFGAALTSGDLNGDGFADLVVGAPYAPGIAGDQSGMVAVFYSRKSWLSGQTVDASKADYLDFGKQAYEWYGYSIETSEFAESSKAIYYGAFLFVGAPNHRLCAEKGCTFSENDTQAVGAVYMYSAKADFALQHQFVSVNNHSRVGSSLAIGRPLGGQLDCDVLAVSAPGQDIGGTLYNVSVMIRQSGGADLYNLTALLHDGVEIKVSSFYGNRGFGRFGHRMQFADFNGDQVDEFYMTAPLHTEDYTQEIYAGEQGVVVVYSRSANASFPIGNVTFDNCGDPASFIIPCPEVDAAAALRLNVDEGHLGVSMAIGHANKQGYTAVGAPHSSDSGSRLSGSVGIYTDFLSTAMEADEDART